jgi:hypothetical protein
MYILTVYQNNFLKKIQDAGDVGVSLESLDKTSSVTKALSFLSARKLVKRRENNYMITVLGIDLLDKLSRPAETIVQPRTHCYMHERYVPEKNTYYRNEGNRHIASRGL